MSATIIDGKAIAAKVRAEVKENIRIFGPGGGFVFSTVHNAQPGTPVENLLAMYETVTAYRGYPLNY